MLDVVIAIVRRADHHRLVWEDDVVGYVRWNAASPRVDEMLGARDDIGLAVDSETWSHRPIAFFCLAESLMLHTE